MSWVNHGRGTTSSACIHGTAASRAPTVQAAKRSVNAAIAADSTLQQDVMSMHRVPTRRSPDPARLDGLRCNDVNSRQDLEDMLEMRLRPSSTSPRSVLERGWQTSPSKMVRSVNKRNRRTRGSSCPAHAPSHHPRQAAGFVAADAFLSSLEDEIATDERSGCDLRLRPLELSLQSRCPGMNHVAWL